MYPPLFLFFYDSKNFSVEKIRVWGIRLEFHPLRIKFPRLLELCIYIQLLLVCSIISFRKTISFIEIVRPIFMKNWKKSIIDFLID